MENISRQTVVTLEVPFNGRSSIGYFFPEKYLKCLNVFHLFSAMHLLNNSRGQVEVCGQGSGVGCLERFLRFPQWAVPFTSVTPHMKETWFHSCPAAQPWTVMKWKLMFNAWAWSWEPPIHSSPQWEWSPHSIASAGHHGRASILAHISRYLVEWFLACMSIFLTRFQALKDKNITADSS